MGKMKLSELRPCDNCGGKLFPTFYVIRLSQALVSAPAANQVLGLTQMFGGALGLAEVMAPEADAVKVFGDEGLGWTQLLVCQQCVLMKDLPLACLMERVRSTLEHDDDCDCESCDERSHTEELYLTSNGGLASGPHDCGPEGVAHDAYSHAVRMIAENRRLEGSTPDELTRERLWELLDDIERKCTESEDAEATLNAIVGRIDSQRSQENRR